MKNYLKLKAGPAVLDILRDEGFRRERVRVFTGPAGGPKWFVSVGFDRGLMQSRFLETSGRRVTLAGASAGAWRCLAMAARSPLDAYERLRIAYSRNIFTTSDTPQTISAKLGENVRALIRSEDIPFIVDHPVYDLLIHTARSRGPAASENSFVQGGALIAAALANVISPAAMKMAYERVVFYSGVDGSEFLRDSFTGRAVRLTRENVAQAALATGSLPCIVAGVRNIAGAPEGVYRDGGIVDYQLNQDYRPGEQGITLFFHYQERIVPGWFDKALSWRKPTRGCVDRLVQVYPGQDFVDLLPGRRLPDRNDFKTFLNDPAERIRRWDRASELSAILWDEFMEAVESNRIREMVKPLS
jgi:hypothetical protein